jgi:hypothetical protein
MIHGAVPGRCLCGDSGGDGRRLVREGKKGNIRTVILPSTALSANLLEEIVHPDVRIGSCNPVIAGIGF